MIIGIIGLLAVTGLIAMAKSASIADEKMEEIFNKWSTDVKTA